MKIIFENDERILYYLTFHDIHMFNIVNWKYNRKPDKIRIKDIKKYILNNTTDFVDGIIYLFRHNNIYYCYDGIHRFTALREIYNENNSKTYYLIVNIYKEYFDFQIKQHFESLNKCVPIPSIYTDAQQELDKRNLIEEVTDYIQNTFHQIKILIYQMKIAINLLKNYQNLFHLIV